jgi:ribosomal-protein-alanine N-acetyltransferase
MNAVLRGDPRLVPMTVTELNAVVVIEAAAYDFPWTRGNFIDSLAAGYLARVLRDASGHVVGYFVALKGVDEMHLLNLTVAPSEQGRGHARRMLDELVTLCATMDGRQLWLEVRESNTRARALYLRYGFRHIGVRRGYYPALQGRREDAAVMSFDVFGGRDDVE